ncbi:helix-turn-helix domain-containing protein [Streptomyces sp. NPDC085481]|uniref:helix-turn-helix domain-containing protein n=1 Tax=Streptomyces sp. NPDC085481 TaxID=3365727 RepID=UPI0037CD7E9B
MYDLATRAHALALVSDGHSLSSVSRQTGISRSALRAWQLRDGAPPHANGRASTCARCRPLPGPPDDTAAYAYLLGLYLGDGCISDHPRGGRYLRIACADAWPGLIEACRTAILAVRPEGSTCALQKQGCVMVTSYGRHWTCLFPQHGPGRKHERPIVLETWQQEIVEARPWELLRGLMHSDGSRIVNRTRKTIAGRTKHYEYPRYFFTNTSDDVVRLYTDTLDRVGVAWRSRRRATGAQDVSVARRDSVALMDAHVGPKY